MHDLDRTQLELGETLEEFDAGEFDQEDSFEFESEYDSESVFDQSMEMELAAELVAVTSDQELDQFLGKLIKSAGRAVGKIVRTPQFKAIGGLLKGVAKKALPLAGTAIGTYFGGPLGAKIGGGLGRLGASLIHEIEMEGIPMEEREFEVARRIVRLGGKAVQHLANAPSTVHPVAAAQKALAQAAKAVIPTASHLMAGRTHGHARTGRWVRSGRNIVVLGAI
jgi:hypothetical protein